MRYQTDLMKTILTNPTAQKIIDYISPIYGDSYVGLWIIQSIGIVLDEVCNVSELLRYEGNPATAELLLDLWERRYGLSDPGRLTTNMRRLRIISKRTSRRACNPERLKTAVSSSLGGAKVEIIENVSRNTFNVIVLEQVESLEPAIAVIERMKPAHLVYNISVLVQIGTDAELKPAVVMTHAERFAVPVAEPTNETNT